MSDVMPIPRSFVDWKRQTEHLPATTAEFERWLFVHVSSVLLGGKAGELLNLPANQFGMTIVERLARVATLTGLWGVSYQVLNQDATATQIVIYNWEKVQQVLVGVSPCVLSCELNYARGLNPAEFLAEVARRWHERGDIPHEIGLALGYPPKDVLGYMGLLPLQCTGCCGWRIYGDPTDSLCQSRMFADARQQAIFFVYRRECEDAH